jgi:hypothetical protein
MTTIGRSRGKRHELAVAHATGGKRNGATGTNSSDVDAGPIQYECKSRASRMPGYITDALDQAARNCAGRLPVVVIHTVGEHRRNDVVMLRWHDWLDWVGSQPLGNTEELEVSRD